MSAKIAWTFPFQRDEKTLVQAPVYVDDVDELGIWVHFETDAGEFLSTCAMWSQVLEQPLKDAVAVMREKEAEIAALNLEETT